MMLPSAGYLHLLGGNARGFGRCCQSGSSHRAPRLDLLEPGPVTCRVHSLCCLTAMLTVDEPLSSGSMAAIMSTVAKCLRISDKYLIIFSTTEQNKEI